MHDAEFTHRDPLYRIGLRILAVDAKYRSKSAPTTALAEDFAWLSMTLHHASRLSDRRLVRRYDELLRETSGAVDVAAMDAMAFIDLAIDTGPMPAVTE